MSFSFIRLGSVADVLSKVRDELAEVVATYPCHAADAPIMEAAVASLLPVLTVKEGEVVQVSLSGSMWDDQGTVRQASFNLSVGSFDPTGRETEFGAAFAREQATAQAGEADPGLPSAA